MLTIINGLCSVYDKCFFICILLIISIFVNCFDTVREKIEINV